MRKSKFTEKQIIDALKAVEAGATMTETCRKVGVSEQTFYRWRSKYGGMDASEARRLRELEDENKRLKQMVAEQALDIQALKLVTSKKWCSLPRAVVRWAFSSLKWASASGVPVARLASVGRAIAMRPSAMTGRRFVRICAVWLPRDRATATADCTCSSDAKASKPITSSSIASTARRAWRCAASSGANVLRKSVSRDRKSKRPMKAGRWTS